MYFVLDRDRAALSFSSIFVRLANDHESQHVHELSIDGHLLSNLPPEAIALPGTFASELVRLLRQIQTFSA